MKIALVGGGGIMPDLCKSLACNENCLYICANLDIIFVSLQIVW